MGDDSRDGLRRPWRRQAEALIAVDTNILVYAHRKESPWHKQAAATLIRFAES